MLWFKDPCGDSCFQRDETRSNSYLRKDEDERMNERKNKPKARGGNDDIKKNKHVIEKSGLGSVSKEQNGAILSIHERE